jgi:sugar-specific transcriptional regulator TrmB
MMNKPHLAKKLNLLGLNDKQAEIYLTLLKHGVLTPLELSRVSQINRSTIYRVLEQLKEMGLAEEILDQHKIKARATKPEKLELLMTQKQTKLNQLKKQIPEIVRQLSAIQDKPSVATKVVYFRGKKGLQQMLWNMLKAKNEHLGYGYADWNASVGRDFAEKLRQEMINRKIYSKEIQNINQEAAMETWTEIKNYSKFYEGRFLPKDLVEIKHDLYIYNDVFAFYHFYEGELFGVEIHNKEIAKTQRQIFEVLWKQAKKATTS